jgi:hypothetical protein
VTPLDKPLKRALRIRGHDYVVTLTSDALKLTQKAHRLGMELKWADIVSGESALAVALNASLGKFQHEAARKPKVKTTNAGASAKRGKRGAKRAG